MNFWCCLLSQRQMYKVIQKYGDNGVKWISRRDSWNFRFEVRRRGSSAQNRSNVAAKNLPFLCADAFRLHNSNKLNNKTNKVLRVSFANYKPTNCPNRKIVKLWILTRCDRIPRCPTRPCCVDSLALISNGRFYDGTFAQECLKRCNEIRSHLQ